MLVILKMQLLLSMTTIFDGFKILITAVYDNDIYHLVILRGSNVLI